MFLTGNNTYAGGSTVTGGKLSIVGTNSSGVTINNGGTLGGTGTVAGTIIVLNGGVLWPGVTAAEAAGITNVNADVAVTPGDVLRASVAKIGLGGRFVATLKAGGVSSRLMATGAVALGGTLHLDVATAPNPGRRLHADPGRQHHGHVRRVARRRVVHVKRTAVSDLLPRRQSDDHRDLIRSWARKRVTKSAVAVEHDALKNDSSFRAATD